jgi:hypothetical protein
MNQPPTVSHRGGQLAYPATNKGEGGWEKTSRVPKVWRCSALGEAEKAYPSDLAGATVVGWVGKPRS